MLCSPSLKNGKQPCKTRRRNEMYLPTIIISNNDDPMIDGPIKIPGIVTIGDRRINNNRHNTKEIANKNSNNSKTTKETTRHGWQI